MAETPRKIRLNKTTVAALPIPADKPAIYWDSETAGFAVRISPRGRRVFFLQARTTAGRQVKLGCGVVGRATIEQARQRAQRYLAELVLDRDPVAEKRAKRQAALAAVEAAAEAERAAITVAQLWEAFERDHVATLRRASQTAYGTWYKCHIGPGLGTIRLADLHRGRIEALLRAIAERSGRPTANRVLAVIGSMLSWGEAALTETGERRYPAAANACRGIKPYPEPGRERDLDDAELRRLISYLAASGQEDARLLELLLATGARKGEALVMRWSDVRGSWWIVPAAVSKSKKAVRRPLNASALAVLAKVRPGRDQTEIFAAVSADTLRAFWDRIRADLSLADLRIHDLRHACASIALQAGAPLSAIAKMLGHGIGSTATARYARLADRQVEEAALAVGDRLAALRDAEPAGHA